LLSDVSPVNARLLTFIALDGSVPRGADAQRSLDLAPEVELFAVEIRPRASEFAQTIWRPSFSAVRNWDPASYQAPHAGTAYIVTRCQTAIVTVPMAGDLLLVDLSLSADSAGLILAEKDAFDPSLSLSLDDLDLLAAAVDGELDGRRLTDQRRQVLLLEAAQSGARMFAGDPAALSPEQKRLLRQLMFKDVDIEYRPAMAPVRAPIDMNGPDLQSIFVWDANTVAEGLDSYPRLVEARVLGVVMSNCQVLGASKRCEEIRQQAIRTVDTVSSRGLSSSLPVELRRSHVEARLLQIGALQQDLSVGVEMHVMATAVAGGRPLLRYHEALVNESVLPQTLAVTRHLLAQLRASIEIERNLLEVQETRESAREQIAIASATKGLLDQSEAFKAASLIFVTVAVVISLAGLFATVAAIPRRQAETMLGSTAGSLLFVVLAVVTATVLGVALRRAAAAKVGRGGRRLLRGVRWLSALLLFLSLAVSLTSALGPFGGQDWLGLGIAGVVVFAITLVFGLATELRFDSAGDTAAEGNAKEHSARVYAEVWPIAIRDGQVHRWVRAPIAVSVGSAEITSVNDAVAAAASSSGLAPIRYLHSTSWRFVDDAVVLTYLAIVADFASESEYVRVQPANGSPDRPNMQEIHPEDALQHGLGHLAFLTTFRKREASEFSRDLKLALASWAPTMAGELIKGQSGPVPKQISESNDAQALVE
jgi:hypothetical protein